MNILDIPRLRLEALRNSSTTIAKEIATLEKEIELANKTRTTPIGDRYFTAGKIWPVVYSSTPVQCADLVFCWMKCDGHRAGRASKQDWELVESFVIVRRYEGLD